MSALWEGAENKMILNGIETDCHGLTAFELRNQSYPNCDIVIVNGYCISDDIPLQETDTVVMIQKGQMPTEEVLETMLVARHTPNIHQKLKQGSVAIAGLGGLGSHIAVMLARTGIGKLLLIDFDIVEPSNLNRQNYAIAHIGMKKTEAMKQQLQQINPYIQIETNTCKLTQYNAVEVLKGYPVLCEAFDQPEAKAELVNTVLEKMNDTYIVAASGMAGYDSSNLIRTVRKMKYLYICGDFKNEAGFHHGLMAPRVQICAGHQANMVLRLLLDIEQE